MAFVVLIQRWGAMKTGRPGPMDRTGRPVIVSSGRVLGLLGRQAIVHRRQLLIHAPAAHHVSLGQL